MQRTSMTFIGEKKHRKGVEKMLRKGWSVESDVSSVPRAGCLTMLTLGLLFRKKTHFMVIFSRP